MLCYVMLYTVPGVTVLSLFAGVVDVDFSGPWNFLGGSAQYCFVLCKIKLISSVHYNFTLLPSIHQLLSEGKRTRCSTTVSIDRFSVFNKVRSFNSKGKEYTQLPFRFANYLF